MSIEKCLTCVKPYCDDCKVPKKKEPNKNAMIVGENLRRMMAQKGLTNTRLGEMCGADRRTISGYVHGKTMPRKDILMALCEALGCTVDSLTRLN